MKAKITTNEELENFVSSMEQKKNYFAVRTKGKIEVFTTKRDFNRSSKNHPNAVQGEITPYNHIWYRF